MGTDTADCRKVAELIGVKTFTNEFIAYGQLKDLIANRQALNNYTTFFNTTDWHWVKDDIILDITKEKLVGGILSVSCCNIFVVISDTKMLHYFVESTQHCRNYTIHNKEITQCSVG